VSGATTNRQDDTGSRRADERQSPRAATARRFLRRWGVALALVLLFVVSATIADRFLSLPNLLNVARQIAIVGVLAIGMTFVIITAGIDLSVGSILAVAAVTTADMVNAAGPVAGVATALAVGAGLGLVNGLGVTYGGVQPFIMTLGMLAFARGLAFVFTGGRPIPTTDPAFLDIGSGRILGIPNPAILFIVLLLLAAFVLRQTTFGRSVYAVGSNDEAARLSGVPVRRVRILVYVISGLCSGVAGLLYASQLGVGTPIAGEAFELDAIAATVVGGTSLFGGQGTIVGTFMGAALLGVLSNILNLTGVDPFVQRLFRGALIVFAVMLQRKDAKGR
jgi:ribose/xylose/arabinose/galactoside ABC-type transport system permease subunit